MDKKEIFNFLVAHNLCVLSTISDNKTQSALMGFGISEDLEFVFGTSNKSRKFKNISKNSSVSVVVGWDAGQTIQYEGKAEILTNTEVDKYKNIYFSQRPSAKRHESLPDQVYFKVKPVWLRYTDVTKDPWEIFEIDKF